ncbi:hypothetical protein SY83_20260 [Paenibacillus swuensis]|uniref:Glycoside hydrolase family 42 N-terminal domain-containing protein n=2 Tax=Paenibacillus swuensis TaxID=1178515 RepID=A0A172TMI0_9BACL|nr:hypothetical protein SY83_20260 [Paenibacillus swuensis]
MGVTSDERVIQAAAAYAVTWSSVTWNGSTNTVSGTLKNETSGSLAMTLVIGIYGEEHRLIHAVTEVTEMQAGETRAVVIPVGEVDAQSVRSVKLMSWDNLTDLRPLSHSVEVNTVSLSPVTEAKLNPYLLFTGKVTRSFSTDTAMKLAADVTQYIDENAKKITSATGELEWKYGQGHVRLNTARSQAVTGKLAAANGVELKDVRITSTNEFGNIAVTSMDGSPIETSRKLLIQAFTENIPYGFRTEASGTDGTRKITALGGGPMNVRNIEATVLLKQMNDISKVYALDSNGRVQRELPVTTVSGGVTVQLPADTMYTLVERNGLQDPYVPAPIVNKPPVYVWWEGESPVSTNFGQFANSDFGAETLPTTRHLLSGGDWLDLGPTQVDEANPPSATYEINVPENGQYSFFVRKFWLHGPFHWRFDGGEWKTLDRNITLLDDTFLRRFIGANWVSMGGVALTPGKHTFEIKLMKETGESVAALDAFLLTKQSFLPSGLVRPGEKLGLAEPGYWAFEPDLEQPGQVTPIDLTYLNEKRAGQSGFIRSEGEKLLLGNGQEARFWGINSGLEVLNLENSDMDYMAGQLAKYGVNAVRLHGELFDENGVITDDTLSRMHYFVHAMKNKGIYTNLSYYFVLWSDMTNAQDYKQPGYEFYDWNKNPFGLLLFDKKQQEVYKKGLRKMLTAPNPYENGTPLAKEPAIANLEIQNEDSFLFWTFADWKYPDKVKQNLYSQFGQWLVARYGSIDAAYDAWGPLQKEWADVPEQTVMQVEEIGPTPWATGEEGDHKRRRDQLRFLVETSRDFYQEMVDFMRDDIGSESMISASNWITADPQKLEALERYSYEPADIIDRHAYFEANHGATNGMVYTVQTGDTFKPEPVVTKPDTNPVKMIHNEGHPSMISEITWTNPTPYTAEGAFFMAAYGAMQGIDVLHWFAMNKPGWSTKIDKWPINTPGIMGQFPAYALMYRRGDIKEAPVVASEKLNMESLYNLKGSSIYESLNVDDFRK